MDDADSERQGGGAAGGQEIYRAAEAAAFHHHLDEHAQQSQQIYHNVEKAFRERVDEVLSLLKAIHSPPPKVEYRAEYITILY